MINIFKRKKPNVSVGKVCDNTGWTTRKAERKIRKIQKHYPEVTAQWYAKNLAWDLNLKEVGELLQLQKTKEAYRTEKREFYLKMVCENTGWDSETAKEKMEIARKKGVTYRRYALRGGWNYTEENFEVLQTSAKKKNKAIKKNKERYIKKIIEATGWTKGKTILEVEKANMNCGASYEDFCIFQMYNLTPEKQRTYVTLDLFEQMRQKYNRRDAAREEVSDKAKFNENFSDVMNRVWFTNQDLTYEEFLEKIKNLHCIVIKPLDLSRGQGVEKCMCNESEEKNLELYQKICSLGATIIEECIEQHEEMKGFCETSVNTIRITTLHYQGECKFLYAVLRMGRDGVVDNFHAGGVVAGVDCESGIVCTNAVDWEGTVYKTSPATGKTIKGFQVPHWDNVLETCKQVTGRIEGVDLIGWDFAITPDGTEIIEGNSGASYVIAQMPFAKEGIGLRKDMIDPYM